MAKTVFRRQLTAYVASALAQQDPASAVHASLRYLQHGVRFMERLLPGFLGIAQGDATALAAAYRSAAHYLVEHEPELHAVVDNRMWQ